MFCECAIRWKKPVQRAVLRVQGVLHAPVVVIIIGGLILGVHLQIEGEPGIHSALVGGIVQGSGHSGLVVDRTEGVPGEVGQDGVEEFEPETGSPNWEIDSLII